jgi:hypothetical protein
MLHIEPSPRLNATAPDMAKLLTRILLASESGNNGLIMGEAVLCPHFESNIRSLLRDAGCEPAPYNR